MTITHAPAYVFIDIETTCLSPWEGDIIEVAAVLTASDFAELAWWSSPIRPAPDSEWISWSLTEHTRSGLLAESAEAPPLREVLTALDTFLAHIIPPSLTERPRAAGYSVAAFDLHWLKIRAHFANAPDITRHLHHRAYDVSVLRDECAVVDPATYAAVMQQGPPPHRALSDCRHAIATARNLRLARRSRC